jgi:diguanylate cyclase (GGDEF)-like protein
MSRGAAAMRAAVARGSDVATMHFDPHTAFTFQFVQALINGCILLLSWLENRRTVALVWWSASHMVAAAAMVAFAVSASLSQPTALGLAHLLLVLYWAVQLVGTRIFEGRSWSPAYLLAPTAAMTAAIAVWSPGSDEAWQVFKGLMLLLALATVHEILRNRPQAPLLRWSLVALIAVHCLLVTGAGNFGSGPGARFDFWGDLIMLEAIAYGSGTALLFIALSKANAESELRKAATTDSLTGLMNRGAFIARAELSLARACPRHEQVALAIFDLDRFKAINDGYGHSAGDEVLRVFARILGATFRATDVVGRLGGEEFAVLLADVPAQEAIALVERARVAFARSDIAVRGGRIPTTVSAGITWESAGDRDLDGMLAGADDLLYRAKANGRNRTEAGSWCPHHAPGAVVSAPPLAPAVEGAG